MKQEKTATKKALKLEVKSLETTVAPSACHDQYMVTGQWNWTMPESSALGGSSSKGDEPSGAQGMVIGIN